MVISSSATTSSASSRTSSYSGGLVGQKDRTVSITNGYWNNSASQSVDGGTTNQSPRAQGNAAVSAGVVTDVAGANGSHLNATTSYKYEYCKCSIPIWSAT